MLCLSMPCPGCMRAACSSALMAFNDAMSDIASGRIDYAVVAGASNILRSQTSLAFQRLHMLSPDVRTLSTFQMPFAHAVTHD